jgi:hypothetical protein
MSELAIKHNLAEFNFRLAQYSRASGKDTATVLQQQGAKLGYTLRQEFRGITPAKGEVKAERLDALKSGEGIHIRQGVMKWLAAKYDIAPMGGAALFRRAGKGNYKGSVTSGGKRLNLQALAVQAELNIREKGRAFLSVGARFQNATGGLTYSKAFSRFNKQLSEAGFTPNSDGGVVAFKWGGFSNLSDSAVQGMTRAKGQGAIARALKGRAADMKIYIDRKNAERARALTK